MWRFRIDLLILIICGYFEDDCWYCGEGELLTWTWDILGQWKEHLEKLLSLTNTYSTATFPLKELSWKTRNLQKNSVWFHCRKPGSKLSSNIIVPPISSHQWDSTFFNNFWGWCLQRNPFLIGQVLTTFLGLSLMGLFGHSSNERLRYCIVGGQGKRNRNRCWSIEGKSHNVPLDNSLTVYDVMLLLP